MKIALLTYSTRPRGSVVCALALAEALAARGEDVTVVGLGRSGDTAFYRPVDARVTVRVVPLPDVVDEPLDTKVARSIAVLGSAVEPADFDVLHAQDCIAANAVACRCVRTVHHLEQFTTPALVACHDRAVREPLLLVTPSRPVAADVLRSYGRDAVVVPGGVDLDRFAAVDRAAVAGWRARLGGAPLLVALGGIEPRKGTLELVEALALLGPAARLAIGGGETLFDHRPYREQVERRIAELGVAVQVLGPLAQDDVAPFLAAGDVVVMPSTVEGFGLTALEALAAGRPVVVGDLPVFRSVFGDSVRYAASPRELAAEVRLAVTEPHDAAPGRALAAALTWDAAAVRHQELYRRLG